MRVPSLLPLLRSQVQGGLLAELYLHPGREYSLTELARRLRVSVKTVHHEVDRLHEAGYVTSRRVGNLRLIAADTTHRLSGPLTDLLAATYGPVPVLSELLAGVPGVSRAYIYGSWAARHSGEAGPVPHDLDVLVVGDADLDALDDVAREARARLGFEVNVQRVAPKRWRSAGEDPFLSRVQSAPLVELDLSPRAA